MVDSGERVRIGIGCVVAAIGAFATSPACGNPDEESAGVEPVSLTAVDQALCHKLIECGCGEAFAQVGLVAPLSCEGWTLPDIYPDEGGYYYGYGYEEGGYYDDPIQIAVDHECLQSFAQRIDALDCNLYLTEVPQDCREFCWPLVGPRHEGEPCTSQLECGRGLLCAAGECRNPCLVDVPTQGASCESRRDCDSSFQVCTSEFEGQGGVCQALPSAGQACYFGECLPGVRCDQGTCVTPTLDGEPCMGHRECASNYCPAGYCRQAPGAGERCGADGACAAGAECLFTDDSVGTCVAIARQCTDLLDTLFDLGLVPVAGF